MHLIKSGLILAAALPLCAADKPGPTFTEDGRIVVGDKTITPKELHEKMERVRLKRTGGIVREAGSAKGVFVIVDGQGRVPRADLAPVCATLDTWVRVQTKLVAAADGAGAGASGGWRAAVKAAGGALGVVLVDEAGLPALLTAPEDGWSVVNVAALAADGPDAGALAARVRKEILRAFAFTTGGAYMTKADFVMRDVTHPGDLDALPAEQFGLEIVSHTLRCAPRYGLVPWRQATYRRACEEGWAPAPTNDVQRAIWEQTRADKERGPANAIRIPPPSARK